MFYQKRILRIKENLDDAPFIWNEVHSYHMGGKHEINILYTPIPSAVGYKAPIIDSADDFYFDLNKSSIKVTTASELFVGGVYPISNVKHGLFDSSLEQLRNPMRFMFNFGSLAYLVKWNEEIDKSAFKKHQEDALKSESYKKFLDAGLKEGFSYKMSEVYSSSEIEKAFDSGEGLAKIFSDYLQTSVKDIKTKSKTIISLKSINYTTSVATPSENGLFQDAQYNNSTDYAYAYSIRYGGFAYILIESPYTYQEVSNAFRIWLKHKFNSEDIASDESAADVLASSKILVYTVDSNFDKKYDVDNLASLAAIMNSNFGEVSSGIPLSITLRTVNGNQTLTNARVSQYGIE